MKWKFSTLLILNKTQNKTQNNILWVEFIYYGAEGFQFGVGAILRSENC